MASKATAAGHFSIRLWLNKWVAMDPLEFMSPSSIVDSSGILKLYFSFFSLALTSSYQIQHGQTSELPKVGKVARKKNAIGCHELRIPWRSGLANCTPRGKMPVSRPINSLALAFELFLLGLHKLVVSRQYCYIFAILKWQW